MKTIKSKDVVIVSTIVALVQCICLFEKFHNFYGVYVVIGGVLPMLLLAIDSRTRMGQVAMLSSLVKNGEMVKIIKKVSHNHYSLDADLLVVISYQDRYFLAALDGQHAALGEGWTCVVRGDTLVSAR